MSSQHGAAKRLRKELMLLERSEATSLAAAATARKKNNRVASSSTWSFNTAEQQQHGSSEELDDDVYLRPASCDSILRWKGLLRGPPDSPYSGGIFQLNIRCGTDYPLAPPNISFDTKVRCIASHFWTNC